MRVYPSIHTMCVHYKYWISEWCPHLCLMQTCLMWVSIEIYVAIIMSCIFRRIILSGISTTVVLLYLSTRLESVMLKYCIILFWNSHKLEEGQTSLSLAPVSPHSSSPAAVTDGQNVTVFMLVAVWPTSLSSVSWLHTGEKIEFPKCPTYSGGATYFKIPIRRNFLIWGNCACTLLLQHNAQMLDSSLPLCISSDVVWVLR